MISNIASRSIHTPMIKFIGKRTPGLHHSTHSTPAPAVSVAAAVPVPQGAKSLSFGATVEFADFPAKRWERLAFSAEEINAINQGTNDVADWRKIKM